MDSKKILNSLIYPPKISSYKFDKYSNVIPEGTVDLLYDKFLLILDDKKENEKNQNESLKSFSLKNSKLFKDLNTFDSILKLNIYKKNNNISFKQKETNTNEEDNLTLIPKINNSYYTRENKIIIADKLLINKIMGIKQTFHLSPDKKSFAFSYNKNTNNFTPINFEDSKQFLKNKSNRLDRMSAKSKNNRSSITCKNNSQKNFNNKTNFNENKKEFTNNINDINKYSNQSMKNMIYKNYNINSNINNCLNNNINNSVNSSFKDRDIPIFPFKKQISSSISDDNLSNQKILNETKKKETTNNIPLNKDIAYYYIEYSYPTNKKICRLHSSKVRNRKPLLFSDRFYKSRSNFSMCESLREKNKKSAKDFQSRNSNNKIITREDVFNNDINAKIINKIKLEKFNNKIIAIRNKMNLEKILSEKYAKESKFYIMKMYNKDNICKINKNKRNRDLPNVLYYLK